MKIKEMMKFAKVAGFALLATTALANCAMVEDMETVFKSDYEAQDKLETSNGHQNHTATAAGNDRMAYRERQMMRSNGDGETLRQGETQVTKRVLELANQYNTLNQTVQQNFQTLSQVRMESREKAKTYYNVFAAINARLQAGTTPGNPVLTKGLTVAQQNLDDLANYVSGLNQLQNNVSSNASEASYLSQAINSSFQLLGAVEADHRALERLRANVEQTVYQIERLQNEVTEDLTRRTQYLNVERRNLQTLSLAVINGEPYGQNLGNPQPFVSSRPLARDLTAIDEEMLPSSDMGRFSSQQPLAVIRFDRPNVPYKQPVYQALSNALERYPDVEFEIVAVSPRQANPAQRTLALTRARRNAEDVMMTLSRMGIPADIINISSYMQDVATNEVHIYLK